MPTNCDPGDEQPDDEQPQRSLSLNVGEASAIWLALTGYRVMCHEDDEENVGKILDRIESLYSADEWSAFYAVRHADIKIDLTDNPGSDKVEA